MNRFIAPIALFAALVTPAFAGPYDGLLDRIFNTNTEVDSGTFEGHQIAKVVIDDSLAAAMPKYGCRLHGAFAYLVFTHKSGTWTYAGCAQFLTNGVKELPVFTN